MRLRGCSSVITPARWPQYQTFSRPNRRRVVRTFLRGPGARVNGGQTHPRCQALGDKIIMRTYIQVYPGACMCFKKGKGGNEGG